MFVFSPNISAKRSPIIGLRKLYFFILTLLISDGYFGKDAQAQGSVPGYANTLYGRRLFSVQGRAISTGEFLDAFKKNHSDSIQSKSQLESYLQLYIQYKLKVEDAYAKGIDKLPAQVEELRQFREQSAIPYLLDQATLSSLSREAAERLKTELFLVAERENKTTQRKSLDTMGWISAFQLPYQIEQAVYALASQSAKGATTYTKPFQTEEETWRFKVVKKQAARGRIQVAQILLSVPPDAPLNVQETVKKRADSLYQALLKGAQFGELAEKFSDDNSSYQNDGVLPPFQTGTWDPSFEAQAYALKTKGAISRPFATSFGWHILLKIDEFPFQPWNTEELKKAIMESDRVELAETAIVQRIQFSGAQKWTISPQNFISACAEGKNYPDDQPVLQTGSRTVTWADWIRFLKSNDFVGPSTNKNSSTEELSNLNAKKDWREKLQQLFNDLSRYEALQHYQEKLEQYEPAFARQVKEFKEGNMLFEIMQREIWDKASSDSAGVKAFFDNNKSKYRWSNSVLALSFVCNDLETAKKIQTSVPNIQQNWRKLQQDFEGKVWADSTRLQWNDVPPRILEDWRKKGLTEKSTSLPYLPISSDPIPQDDGSYLVYIACQLFPGGDPKTMEEARGELLNDYQNYLENSWLDTLKKKYTVRMNQNEWNEVLKNWN